MKRLLFTTMAALFIFSANAQKIDTLKGLKDDTLIFAKVEHAPEFPGGLKKFHRYLSQTLRYPATSKEKNIQGTVIISMIVEKDGSLTHLKVAHGVADDIDQEALRIMNLSPKWNPGTQNGAVVRTAYSVPISFMLSN